MSSERAWVFRIEHILEAIEKIERYTEGLNEDDLAADEKSLDAVVRNFQVIGEAARKVPQDIRDKWHEIPWGQMMRMRHILVHDYERLDVGIIYRTARTHLPLLAEPLRRLLEVEGQ